jgi:transposase
MELTNAQWSEIEHCFPASERNRPGAQGGRPFRNPRDVLNGVLWMMRTGAPWADMPRRYPPYQTSHRRFQKWVRDGVFECILKELRSDPYRRGGVRDVEAFIDGTYVEAKKGALVSENVARATPRRSWRSQTAMVFHSLSLLLKEPDTTLFSPSELSTLRSLMCSLES